LVILRQLGYLLEELGTAVIVKPERRQLFGGLRQSGSNVVDEGLVLV